jgi:hypothetical protein
MKLEIDIDVVDQIIVNTMKEDYISQQNDIARLLSKTGALRDFEREDLWMHKETSDALEVILRYYMYRGDADVWIAEHKLS